MKSLLWCATLGLILLSCATNKPVFQREGKQVYEATCNGTARSIATCHEMASEQCNGSYEVFDTETSSGFAKIGNNYQPTRNRSLLYYCKAG